MLDDMQVLSVKNMKSMRSGRGEILFHCPKNSKPSFKSCRISFKSPCLLHPNIDSINTNSGIGIGSMLTWLDQYFVSVLQTEYVADTQLCLIIYFFLEIKKYTSNMPCEKCLNLYLLTVTSMLFNQM